MTNELPLVHRALARAGVSIRTLKRVTEFDGEAVTLADVYTGEVERIACRSLVIVGMRRPRQELYDELSARGADLARAGIASVNLIGDAQAPGAIVHAVHGGHRFARDFESPADTAPTPARDAAPYERDFPV
jgi:dimethylamine/trimethylamine dehydrogenase